MVKNKKFLITGANGQLAKEFISFLEQKCTNYVALTKDQLDITDFESSKKVISEEKPDILLNCAAYNLVDQAEDEPEKAFKINSEAVSNLAAACKENDIFFVHFSSDYVFDGTKSAPYTEEDKTSPLNVYGQSKLGGEEGIRQALRNYLIFRVSWVFGNGKQNFLYKLLQWAKNKNELQIVEDECSVPTYTEDIVQTVLKALEMNLTGMYHLTNSGKCSRYEWVKYFCEHRALEANIVPVGSSQFPVKAKRPLYTRMSNEKICNDLNILIPTWQDAVNRFIGRKCLEVI